MLTILIGPLCACAGDPPQRRYAYAQMIMGVEARITLLAPSALQARAAAAAAFARMADLESVMSDYRPDSELMRVCDQAGSGPVAISGDLARVLERAGEITEATDGAFDVTVGPVVRLWREARRSGRLPDGPALERALRLTGWEGVGLDAAQQRIELRAAGMRLDLGGIGKGFAVDEAGAILDEQGVRRWLVDLGGDLAAGDAPPGAAGWRVALASADAARPATVLLLERAAVAMSGDAEQHVEIGGVRYSHIVDPRTGLGLTDRARVAVVAPDAATADALASALSVLGPQRGLEALARFPGASARFDRCEGARVRRVESPGFPAPARR